jgi:monofunctional glycosyltransferase
MKKPLVKIPLLFLLAGLLFGLYSVATAYFAAASIRPEIPRLKSDDFIQKKLGLDSWVPLSKISRPAVDAILTSEDDRFYQHPGYDLKSIRDAVKTDLRSRRFKRGASTLTQQIVKNVFLERKKSLGRKIQELFLALEVESEIEKDRILEIYLNTAQFGPDLYGIGWASYTYFGKEPSALTPREGAFLAMLLPSPVRYEKSFRDKKLTPYAEKTVKSILRKMVVNGRMREEDLAAEIERPFPFEATRNEPTALSSPTPAPPSPSPTLGGD